MVSEMSARATANESTIDKVRRYERVNPGKRYNKYKLNIVESIAKKAWTEAASSP